MIVKDKHINKQNAGHSIEWGDSTWDINKKSIRNRYDNIQTGKFNKAGSGEIPWDDFKLMIQTSIEQNKFTNAELIDFLKKIAKVL